MKRKFFLKRAGSYLVMMLIPMVILFLAFAMVNVDQINKDIKAEGARTTDLVNMNFELVLSNAIYQNDLLTSTTRMNISLRRILSSSEMTYSDAVNVNSLRGILNSIQQSHEYIASIYIYLDGGERYFSSEEGIRTLTKGDLEGWVSLYQKLDKTYDTAVSARTTTDGSGKEIRVLTVFKKLLLQNGCIALNINLNDLETILEKQLQSPYETLYLVNREGKILGGKSGNKTAFQETDYFQKQAETFQESWTEELKKRNQDWISIDGNWMLLNVPDYKEGGISYVSLISMGEILSRVGAQFLFFGIVLAMDVAVAVLLAYRNTRRSFDQIFYMMNMLDEAEQGLPVARPEGRNRDEYDVILNNMVYLFLNTNYLKSQVIGSRLKKEQAEMMALQLQINPHFLFNTLQTIEMQAREGTAQKEEMCTMIQNISAILKYALSSPQEPVRLEEEILYLKKYIAIQKMRFGDQFIIYYDVDEEAAKSEVFRMFLQPLVENSFLHGIRGMDRKGYIKVTAFRRGNWLRCCVTDSGKGMSREKTEELKKQIRDENARGIGVTNLQRRLVLRYGEESSLHISSRENVGTVIYFYIPFEKEEK